jgi:hypothetical protein
MEGVPVDEIVEYLVSVCEGRKVGRGVYTTISLPIFGCVAT